jgi:ATP-dependent exoDNAse (exonuclease V) beta subunit
MFIDGVIDLIFEDERGVTVVDFKTDKDAHPSHHIPQLTCYYRAASALRKKNVRVMLFYLRTGKIIDVTKAIEKIDAENNSQKKPGDNA